MNSLIQELADQCVEKHTTYFDRRGNVTETSFNRYKFAELIIQECAKFLDEKSDYDNFVAKVAPLLGKPKT